MSGESRTEKPTPRRIEKARNEGQVARSVEINSALVLLVIGGVLMVAGPRLLAQLEEVLRVGLLRAAHPEDVDGGLGGLSVWALKATAIASAPIALASLLAGLAGSTMQVRPRVTPAGLKPRLTRLNPGPGLKRILGKEGIVEAVKALVKTSIVGTAAYLAVKPLIEQAATLGWLTPRALLGTVGSAVDGLILRVGAAFVLIAGADYAWQRYRHLKSLKMTVEEVKQEAKNTDLPPEVRSALRRRQLEQARRRMMNEVPTADVVVVNPTHFAAALRYDGTRPAPELVAKGADLVAAAIRRAALENGVPIVSDPPLARALYRDVKLGQTIPEELYVAVAEVLAFVFRTAGRRRRLTA